MKIISKKELRSGKSKKFITEDFKEYSLLEIVSLCEKGKIDNSIVVKTKKGKYIRTKPNKKSSDNIEAISITCNERDFLFFDRKYLYLKTINGRIKKKWKATSGRTGTTIKDQNKKNEGPLPEGDYVALFQETKHQDDSKNIWDKLWWIAEDFRWGDVYTPLKASPNTNTYGRDSFYIHGGWFAGSAGCIDLTGKNEQFHSIIRLYERNFRLVVKYGK